MNKENGRERLSVLKSMIKVGGGVKSPSRKEVQTSSAEQRGHLS